MDLDDYADFERKSDRENGRDPRERLGAKRTIQHGIPNVPQPEAQAMIEGRTMAPAVPRSDVRRFPADEDIDVKFTDRGNGSSTNFSAYHRGQSAQGMTADDARAALREKMGGHSMHTGDNSNGSSSPSGSKFAQGQAEVHDPNAALEDGQAEFNRKVKSGIDPKRLAHGA